MLLAVVLVSLPVALRRVPDAHLDVAVVVLGLLAAMSLVAWLVGRRIGRRGRTVLGWALVAMATVVLLLVAHLAVPERPEHALPFAAGVTVSIAPVRRAALRLPVQALVVVGMGVLLYRADRAVPELAASAFLLAFVVWLSGRLARSLLDARRSQLHARRAAERRAELLAAVRDLAGRDASEAAATVIASLRSLGFSSAGVGLERDGLLVPLALDGLSPAAIRFDVGPEGDALADDRTIVSGEQPTDDRVDGHGRPQLLVAVPIRLVGRPRGVLLCGWDGEDGPADEMVEFVEVLAAHLGGVLETEDRRARQQELLGRMEALEDMRSRLVTEVSEEVRDPLTVVRGIAETLLAHGDALPADRRARLLEGFQEQVGTLHDTVDTLLDFSRLQPTETLPSLGVVRVGDLLAPLVSEEVRAGDLDAVVRTDPSMLERALAIIASLGPVERATVTSGADGVQIEIGLGHEVFGAAPRSRLLLRLAQRLVLAVGGRCTVTPRGVELVVPSAEGEGAEVAQ